MSVNVVNKSTGELIRVAGKPIQDASNINYDNTTSGLVATKVQGAIDELGNSVSDLDSWTDASDVSVTGNPITISDAAAVKAKALSMTIEPIQDLHGYDHPWVGGAGDNKFSGSDNTYTRSDQSATKWLFADVALSSEFTGAYYISFDYLLSEVGATGEMLFYGYSNGTQITGNICKMDDKTTSTQWKHFSGLMSKSVTFDAIGCYSDDLISIKNIMVSASEPTDFAPYTNICPISGLTSADAERVGKNWFKGYYDYNNLTEYSPLLPNTQYTISAKSDGSKQVNYQYIYKDNSFGGNSMLIASGSTSGSVTVTTPDNVKGINIYTVGISSVSENIAYDGQLELGSTATTYEPYQSHTATITFGQTVYGGEVDFNTGVMTVTHKYVDMGTFGWFKDSTNVFKATLSDGKYGVNLICSQYYATTNVNVDGTIFFNNAYYGDNKMAVCDSRYVNDTAETFATAMDGVQLVYELATPITIQLAPDQLELLKGYNTITANGATISLTYQPDNLVGEVMEKVDEKIAVVDGEKQDKTDNSLATTAKTVVGAINELKSSLTDTSSSIEELQAYTGYSSTDIIGIEVDYANKSFRRLGAAVGKNGGSDFDAFPMFGGRRRCNVADDGTISQYYGDTGYAEDGSNGQVMVYQPKFYYKVVPLKLEKQSTGKGYHIRKAAYYVTATPMKGFKVHPAFVNASGNEVDYILVGASKGCIYDVSESAYILDDAQVMDNTADKFSSIFGVKPASGLTQDLTRPKIEQMCQNRGANWHELNVQMASMTQLLMLIEYGKFDMQRAIGKGVVDITDNSSYNCAATSGSTSALGNASGRAASTTIVTDTSTTYTVDGKTSVTYRGEEDPYGDMWEFVMGMNIYGNGSMNGGEPYICSDYNYAESKNTDNYKGAGFTVANSDGYVNAWGYGSEDFDWLFIASEVGGSDALPVGDYLWKTANLNGYRIALLGARWFHSWMAGGFSWDLNIGVGYRNRHIGSRLAYIPA